ncbi:MAG: winged helix-turn-helix transcriptional regulator [Deltaproteobacteria bacterium]|nr:winged helix-turn-helix transcriptional regulator [Deltaproteobacteria bacterium]
MLSGVITSKTKINILVKLFLNPAMKAYLRELASEFKVSTNSVRTELNNLTKNGVLVSKKEGRNVYYRANTEHPLFPELSSMVRKITGIDELAHSVIDRLGNLETAYLTGDYAEGKDTGIIDVILIGSIDREKLDDVIVKTERYIGRKIRPLILDKKEFDLLLEKGSLGPVMKLWDKKTHKKLGNWKYGTET